MTIIWMHLVLPAVILSSPTEAQDSEPSFRFEDGITPLHSVYQVGDVWSAQGSLTIPSVVKQYYHVDDIFVLIGDLNDLIFGKIDLNDCPPSPVPTGDQTCYCTNQTGDVYNLNITGTATKSQSQCKLSIFLDSKIDTDTYTDIRETIGTLPRIEVKCENNYTRIGRSCYKIYADALNKKTALKKCKRDNASLVALETKEELKAMGDYWDKNNLINDWYRIGAWRPNKTGKWIWNWNNLENTTICTLQEFVPKFIQKRIKNSTKRQTVAIRKDLQMKWEFKRIWAGSKIFFICETIPQMPDCGRDDSPLVCKRNTAKHKWKWRKTIEANIIFVAVVGLTMLFVSVSIPKQTPREQVEDLALSSLRHVLNTETTATMATIDSETTVSTAASSINFVDVMNMAYLRKNFGSKQNDKHIWDAYKDAKNKMVAESSTYTTTLDDTYSFTSETTDTSQFTS